MYQKGVFVSFQVSVSRLRPFLTPPKTAHEKKLIFFDAFSQILFFDAFLFFFLFFLKGILGKMRQNNRVLEEMRKKFLSHFYGMFLGGQKWPKMAIFC